MRFELTPGFRRQIKSLLPSTDSGHESSFSILLSKINPSFFRGGLGTPPLDTTYNLDTHPVSREKLAGVVGIEPTLHGFGGQRHNRLHHAQIFLLVSYTFRL